MESGDKPTISITGFGAQESNPKESHEQLTSEDSASSDLACLPPNKKQCTSHQQEQVDESGLEAITDSDDEMELELEDTDIGSRVFRAMLSEYMSDIYTFQAWLREDLDRLEELVVKSDHQLRPPYQGPTRYLPINFSFVLGHNVRMVKSQLGHLLGSINSAQLQVSCLRSLMEIRRCRGDDENRAT